MNLTEENIIGVKELNENENISLSDFVPVQKENETEIKKISLEKILLAVSKMTNEQKQILNSALALIDDENISSEKTFSSEKINSQIETVTTSKVAENVSAMDFAILQNKNDIEKETEERTNADKNLQSQIDESLIYEANDDWHIVKIPKIKVAFLWREITDLVSQLKISVPVTFNSVSSYKVYLTPSRNGSIVTKFWEGDTNGNTQRTTTSFYVACSRSSSSTINLNCLVVGKYN